MRNQPLLGTALALLLTTHAAALARPAREPTAPPVEARASGADARPSFSAILASLSLGASLGQLVVFARRRNARGRIAPAPSSRPTVAAPALLATHRADRGRPGCSLLRRYM
jgi:hypothetical protein